MTYRVARSVLTLHKQLKRGAPRAAPPATDPDSWGTLGDVLHDTTSDHAPHDLPGLGDDVVTAGDFPNVPGLGLDAHKVLDDIRRSRDGRAKYGISNDQIFSNHAVTQDGVLYPAWTWRPYLPHDPKRDRHYEHGHLSVVGDARADGDQPWQTIGGPANAAAAGEDDNDMGASLGPIEIQREGVTSLTIPPVEAGAADPRPAWLNVCNDLGDHRLTLRIWWTSGNGVWTALGTADGGIYVTENGKRISIDLPKGCCALTISRQPTKLGNRVIEDVFTGHATVCVERGALVR
jgi:hypothetical protein